jgi:hypothetical protein
MGEPVCGLHDLPELFHSDETGAPFERCFDCGNPTADGEDGYVIQKAFARGETIMEMAICCDCHGELRESYSKESRERIWNFYLDHGDLPKRLRKFQAVPVGNPAPRINACMTSGSFRHSLPEDVVAAHVLEGDLVDGDTLLMICHACLDKIVEMLSEESCETDDRWMDRIAPEAPGLVDD